MLKERRETFSNPLKEEEKTLLANKKQLFPGALSEERERIGEIKRERGELVTSLLPVRHRHPGSRTSHGI